MSRRARSTPTRTPVQEPVEERCGSSQSPTSLAKDIAAQPALLAAARTSVKATMLNGTKRPGILKKLPKKVFVFKKPNASTSQGGNGFRTQKKVVWRVKLELFTPPLMMSAI